MKSTNKTGIQRFIEDCYRNGLRTVVCSPGSRNAPIVIALDESKRFNLFVVHDERSAGFIALGLAIEKKEPVAVLCTSGSAVVNYFPAVTEAFYQSVPLVVISADRPTEWINQGDGQTIMQEGVFGKHVRGTYTVNESCESTHERSEMSKDLDALFDLANGNWKGPVHINIPLNEPLYQTVDVELFFEEKAKVSNKDSISDPDNRTIDKWNQFERKMILCGQLPFNQRLQDQLNQLSEDPSVLVLVENTSNLQGKKFVHCIDRTLAAISENEIEQFQPELLVTIGGAIISKRIKSFLRNTKKLTHWKVGYEFPAMDTYQTLKASFEISPVTFFEAIEKLEKGLPTCNFGGKWKQKDYLAQDALLNYLRTIPYSDFSVFQTVLDFIPDGAYLHMANSSVVRYCQLFDPIHSIHYFSNRGTSGIDGSTSTAVGTSIASSGQLNILITGDVSFFYDSNGLWNQYVKGNFKVILINNGGGGIFRIIDGPATSDQLSSYFEARHQTNAAGICQSYGVAYQAIHNLESLEGVLGDFLTISDQPGLIEIHTPTELNAAQLNNFFEALKSLT